MAFKGSIEKGTTAQRPTTGLSVGTMYFNTSSTAFEIYDGTNWNQLPFGDQQSMLDDFSGPAGAYSVRKVRSAYNGPCMKVRRQSDNALQDIYFTSDGDLDETSIASHCSGTIGEVHTWYDQSGNNKDAVQTGNNQPYIYENNAVVKDVNGRPALRFSSSDTTFLTITNQTMGGGDVCFSAVVSIDTDKEHYIYGGGYSTDHSFLGYIAPNQGMGFGNKVSTLSTGIPPYLALAQGPTGYVFQFDRSLGSNNLTSYGANEGNSGTTTIHQTNSLTADHHIGWAIPRNKASAYFSGKLQELIMWNDNKNDGRVGDLFTNMREYYSLYVSLSSSGYSADDNKIYIPANDQGNQYVAKIRTSANLHINKPNLSVSALIVAGGGGGGSGHTGSSLGAGGGGAGGLRNETTTYGQGVKTASVGAGGAGADGPTANNGAGNYTAFPGDTGANGGNTTFDNYPSTGGGGGATRNAHEQGKDGGSGGGACGTANKSGGSGTSGQGNDGGDQIGAEWSACGGGGHNTGGVDATGGTGDKKSTNGGSGSNYSIDGVTTAYAGGGGGGEHQGGTTSYGNGGTGGGGRGGDHGTDQGQPGVDGLGGGGGGGPAYIGNAQGDSNGGDGGDGVIVLRWTGSTN